MLIERVRGRCANRLCFNQVGEGDFSLVTIMPPESAVTLVIVLCVPCADQLAMSSLNVVTGA